MRQVIVGLGSSQDAIVNFRCCLNALEARFGEVHASPMYQSADVRRPDTGSLPALRSSFSNSSTFHNMVVAFSSDASPAAIKAWCKAQERAQGRLPQSAGAGTHPVDIDLLAVGELCGEFESEDGAIDLPHGDILRHAFVLRPLAELLPGARHPQEGTTYAELWQRARASERFARQPLRPVAFNR